MWKDRPSVERSFAAHLRARNAERLYFASRSFVGIMLVLLLAELVLPALWPSGLVFIKIASALYFCGLAFLCRSGHAASRPVETLPLLFGAGATVTGILFSLDLGRHYGATPVYATMVFVACLAPLWPRRALVCLLLPVHVLYLASVFAGQHDVVFQTVMTMGGTAALPLGGITAILALRNERQAFTDMAAIRALLDERRDMVAMVAHDLQSPLAGIRALLRTIGGQSEADAGKLADIAQACGDMYGAVTRLVEAHRHDADEPPDLATAEVDALFHRAAARATAVAAEKGITLIADEPKLSVRVAPSLLNAILDNFLANAIKFSPRGSVVRLTAEARDAEVRLCVVDNGPGIAAEEVPLLFRKFSRLRTQPTGGEPTTGLGLYIVRTLAERMGAHAGFAPNPGGGSIFYVDVPRPR